MPDARSGAVAFLELIRSHGNVPELSPLLAALFHKDANARSNVSTPQRFPELADQVDLAVTPPAAVEPSGIPDSRVHDFQLLVTAPFKRQCRNWNPRVAISFRQQPARHSKIDAQYNPRTPAFRTFRAASSASCCRLASDSDAAPATTQNPAGDGGFSISYKTRSPPASPERLESKVARVNGTISSGSPNIRHAAALSPRLPRSPSSHCPFPS